MYLHHDLNVSQFLKVEVSFFLNFSQSCFKIFHLGLQLAILLLQLSFCASGSSVASRAILLRRSSRSCARACFCGSSRSSSGSSSWDGFGIVFGCCLSEKVKRFGAPLSPCTNCRRVIILSVHPGLIIEGLQPLTEFEVILVLCLDELVNVHISLDFVLGKGCLQKFVVLDVFIVRLCLPVDSRHGDGSRKDIVRQLASNSS
mmetsp:Transcript_24409/g.41467  ORF Transcript_24409/g.41467 Transcript_24409/m.41467 type:complete len:202 (+) Transcript_24409:295-900(+)